MTLAFLPRRLLVLFVPVLLLFLRRITGGRADAIPTVPELNLEAYLGRWYQVYANRVVTKTIERDGVCVFATYRLLPGTDGLILVRNVENVGTPDGEVSSVMGVAFQPRPSAEPGRLLVKFSPDSPPGTYWIIKLGPLDCDEYEYSVVTDAEGLNLFVLARDVEIFKVLYEEEVREFVRQVGFTGWLKQPIPTRQEGCTYDLEDEEQEDDNRQEGVFVQEG